MPPTEPRVPGRIVAMASADAPMKGIATLLEAFAKLRTERDVELLLVTRPEAGRPHRAARSTGSASPTRSRFVTASATSELVEVMGSAEVACVPSLYEGFSLPTAELMACETPLVVSRAGAIPEVVGPDGAVRRPGHPRRRGRARRTRSRALLDDPERRARMGAAGRERVLDAVQLARGGRGHRGGVRSDAIDARRGETSMLTVDFDRLGLRPGDRVIDMGCGAGRHAFEMYRRGADVIAFDQDADELAGVLELFGAMSEAGEVPAGAEADIKQGDALSLPFADGEFDRVVASEVLEHIPADTDAIAELVRVLRPGGTMAVTVPRWLPEQVCWALSDAYHEVEGGHVRIYTGERAGRQAGQRRAWSSRARDHAHGLHSPYWWIKCAVGVDQRPAPAGEGLPPVLVWDIMKQAAGHPAAPSGRSNPLIGKSMVLYLRKPERRVSVGSPRSPALLDRARSPRPRRRSPRMQEPDGAVPWTVGEHIDVWNHVEAAMALLVGGEVDAARARPTTGAWRTQRADGSWPMKVVAGVVEDASGETNMCAYLAVGVWHHWLVRRDEAFVRRCWPAVRRGAGLRGRRCSCRSAGIAWSQECDAAGASTRRRWWPAARASTRRCAPASRSPS